MSDKIDKFEDENRYLSNFAICPIRDTSGVEWASAEHWYQASKCTNPEDREMIRLAETPGKAKKLGKTVECRPDWDQVKDEIMLLIVSSKSRQNPDLKDKLLATGDAELIEGNWWDDTYWGVCKGIGQNKLGLILQKVREVL